MERYMESGKDEGLAEAFERVTELSEFKKEFLDNRKIYVWGTVQDDMAQDVVSRMLYLESKKPGEPITLYINSPGGVVTSGMVIHDTMKMIKSPVHTVCMGMAASMASILLSAGEKGQRSIWPHGRVMIHQPSVGTLYGSASDLQIHAKEIIKTKDMAARILAENCKRTKDDVMADFDRDYWMDPKESVDYGIVDKISDKIDLS
jgi:ATP-dependent Clp protease protease subunit